MSSMRQVGSGLLYALVSVVLVVGGLSLALAEGDFSPAASPTPQLQSTSQQPPFTALTSTAAVLPTSTGALPGTTAPAAASETPGAIVVTTTGPLQSFSTASFTPRPTATYRPPATAVRCGPYAGWVFAYIVQRGDTLFHISTLYRTTVTALQAANCKQTTLIVPGERLWVPNVPTITPGATFIPTIIFTTSTPVPTEPLTETVMPASTETPTPTSGSTGP